MTDHVERRGGRRAGAGRKVTEHGRVTYSVRITRQQAELLKVWGAGDLSAGVRWLVDSAAPLVGVAVVARVSVVDEKSEKAQEPT